jgi:hypothetical protein
MSIETRLEKLEAVSGQRDPITIRVIRLPPDVPEDAQAEYIRAHPECISKTVEIPAA